MDDEQFLNETIDPAQAAWAAYVSKNGSQFTRDCIDRVHMAFMDGWNTRDREDTDGLRRT